MGTPAKALIAQVRAIPHVDFIRIGTRVPVCLPMRVDAELCAMLRKYHPLYINMHFNHPKELTAEARRACEQHVVERLAAGPRGVERDLELLLHALLADEVVEPARAQRQLELLLVLLQDGRDERAHAALRKAWRTRSSGDASSSVSASARSASAIE